MADTKQKTGAKPSKRVLDKRNKKRLGDSNEPTKEEYAVAKYVRFKCPTKTTMFGHGSGGEEVKYFIGSKAVDCLMESKWSKAAASSKKNNQPLFTDRKSCVAYMHQLLMKGLFFRAKKLVPKIKEKPKEGGGEKKTKDQTTKESPKAGRQEETEGLKRRKKDKEIENVEDAGRKETEKDKDKDKDKDEDDAAGGNEKGKGKASKTRKVRLDFHAEQLFIDGASIYVWKYDPTSTKTFLLGLGIVFGAIALCLFPLWPLQIRSGVYYLSLAAMGLLGSFIGLVVLRSVIFGITWLVTFGRHHFWLLPNLTEDCGVLESFQPFYSHKYVAGGSKSSDDTEKKKKEHKSDSEQEDEGEAAEGEEATRPAVEEERESAASENSDSENEEELGKDAENSASGSQNSSDSGEETGDSNDSAHSSAEEEGSTSTDKLRRSKKEQGKQKRRLRRDDGHDSNNGDFEFVEDPTKGES